VIIATSALMALWRNTAEVSALHAAIMRSPMRLVSAATVVEAGMVMMGERPGGSDLELDALLRELDVTTVPFTEDHAHRAREAARTYGKCRHPAGLTFGDCMAYALAVAIGEPVLSAGEHFARTDIERVAI